MKFARRKPAELPAPDEADAGGNIDLGLAVIAAVTAEHCPGRAWSRPEIAEVCGVTRERIRQIEVAALGKLARELARRENLPRIPFPPPVEADAGGIDPG